MKPKRKIDLRKLPRSGDLWTDWIFKMLLYILKHHIHDLKWKRTLRDTKTKKGIYGTTDAVGNIELFLGIKNKPEAVITLQHEIGHRALPLLPESMILEFETLAWTTFTEAQKRFLERHLPRKVPISKRKRPRT